MEVVQVMRRYGWICFGLMWIPFTTLMISMIGMPEGDYAWFELPWLARFSLIAVGGFFFATFALIFGAPVYGWLVNRAVLEEGVMAQATIVDVWDTGTTINENPLVGFKLEVQPPGELSFEAETEKVISRLEVARFQPGVIVRVKYDPESMAVALEEVVSESR